MDIHKGHRDRLRQRFCQEGLDNFNEIQVLELLLCYCIPRRDTNILAHHLIERFGSLYQVLEAPVEELEKVDGIGHNTAVFLQLMTSLKRYYEVNRTRKDTILTSTAECGRFLAPRFDGRRNEMVYLLCLDAKCKVIACEMLGEGSVNSAGVPIRRIVETALRFNASTVVLAHNHPSGLALPSSDDIHTTHRVAAALDAVEIVLADHIIVADDDFVSLVQSGYYCPSDCSMRI